MSGKISSPKSAVALAAFALALLTWNRAASKIGLGGIYYLDILILTFIILYPKYIIRFTHRNPAALGFLLTGAAWLAIESSLYQIDTLHLRRFALSFYIFAAIIFSGLAPIIGVFIQRHFLKLCFASFFGAALGLPDISPTLSCQFLGALLLYAISGRWYGVQSVSKTQILVCAFLFSILTSGAVTGQSIYRTPALAFGVSFCIVLFSRVWIQLRIRNTMPRSFLYGTIAILLFAAPFLLLTAAGHGLVQQLLFGIGGIVNSQEMIDFARNIAPYAASDRGDSAGNASVRTVFWTAILENSSKNTITALFGEGHQFNFLTALDTGLLFSNPELIEPHNSFISTIFRYGYIGLTLLGTAIYLEYRTTNRICNNKIVTISFTTFAIIFASFEVALESPHGAALFWFIMYAPRFYLTPLKFDSKTRSNKYITTSNNTCTGMPNSPSNA